MQEWFNRLSARERVMVAACAAFVLVAVGWVSLIQPLVRSNSQLDERVQRKQSQLALWHEIASRLPQSPTGEPGRRTVDSAESIVLIIDRTTRERQLSGYLRRNQPEGTGVRVRFENAPFDMMVTWMATLREQHGMVIVSANFDYAGAGLVNSSMELRRRGW